MQMREFRFGMRRPRGEWLDEISGEGAENFGDSWRSVDDPGSRAESAFRGFCGDGAKGSAANGG